MRKITILLALLLAACTTTRPPEPAGAVARMWHGLVPDAKAAEYYDYLVADGITKIEKTPGNLGADVFTRSRDGVTEFIVISYWRSLEDIKGFAGADIEKTHNLARDPDFLLEMEPNVKHFTVRRANRK